MLAIFQASTNRSLGDIGMFTGAVQRRSTHPGSSIPTPYLDLPGVPKNGPYSYTLYFGMKAIMLGTFGQLAHIPGHCFGYFGSPGICHGYPGTHGPPSSALRPPTTPKTMLQTSSGLHTSKPRWRRCEIASHSLGHKPNGDSNIVGLLLTGHPQKALPIQRNSLNATAHSVLAVPFLWGAGPTPRKLATLHHIT